MITRTNYIIQTSPFLKEAVFFRDKETPVKSILLYFHGGGLLCGKPDDLPGIHLETLTEKGYGILAFDYPLAPAASVEMILEDVLSSIRSYTESCSLPYFLWGRSAGAYLCLTAAARISADPDLVSFLPSGLLSYYGYGFLTDGWYDTPAPWYEKLPPVPGSVLESLSGTLHTKGDLDTHYSAYVYARQTGTWLSLFYKGEKGNFLSEYSLCHVDSFPFPLFCAHSTGDPDVPFEEFNALSEKYRAKRHVAAAQAHDFDRTSSAFTVKLLLSDTVRFLDGCL